MQRYLCWDKKLFDNEKNIQVIMHKPEKKNVALICDDVWEGIYNGYASVIKVGDVYRMYYRACRQDNATLPSCMCVAESYDGGITFKKPKLNMVEFDNTKENNIFFSKPQGVYFDNFAVIYDTNPDCPKDEKFKALCSTDKHDIRRLLYYASEDGYNFREMYHLPMKGRFDSFNVAFWDEETKQYFCYYRAYHSADNDNILNYAQGLDDKKSVRDIRVATSKDFINWTEHGRIGFDEGQDTEVPLYINQISKYYREKNTFIGFPVVYIVRYGDDLENLKHFPYADKRLKWTSTGYRMGFSFTDSLIMTSNDGFTFDRRDNVFLGSGPQDNTNWWYGSNYTVYGLVETPSDMEGAPNEISFYAVDNTVVKSVNFRRYTVRLDGFFSWYGDIKGAEVLTKPIEVAGDNMRINFGSSCMGGIVITLCDEDGNELEGYKTYTIFGDSVDRLVEFKKPLSELKGKKVKIKFKLNDAHLYSFMFE